MTKDEALEQPKLTDEKGRPMTYCGGLEQPQPRLFLDLSNSHGNHPVEQPAQDYVFICKRCGDDLGIVMDDM